MSVTTAPDYRVEKALLGAIIVDPAALAAVAGVVGIDDFAHPHGQRIYRAMLVLRARGVPVDYVTLCHELERDGSLQRIGIATVTGLINDCATSLHALHYAACLADEGRERRGDPPALDLPAPEVAPPKARLTDRLDLDDDAPVPAAPAFDPNESF